uniref:Uncharacterized protein n=2 Tax=Phaseolus vulgaris TaxID=3885 RepID=V7AIR6_PHAVU|nr:hypothetical protein PHAVU_011G184400g [Phaseolus vulgaris]ESW05497.1 hypothetical protein PHAVU_011G184400g [Phaseolus vulgaris]
METCEEPKSIIESQMQANEALTSPKATSDFVPQKGEEGISQNAKNQREVNFESSERKRVNGKERKNASASGKPPQKGKKEGIMDETIGCKIGDRKGKEKVEMNGKFGDIGSSKWIGIKEVAASASQAVTSLLKGFNEDEHVLLYTSATVLVLGLGVYASYKKLHSLATT